ncbi:MAG TPA: undecaprenyl-diphosphate phosphatase [Patescibacteria group bacterium]|nr:undecaprenyl-diphosphate phosphatase [Patescibacteria group bacterium]
MNLLDVIFLSIVEGITEFLPISSTGHLVLTAHALGVEQTAFVKSFEIIIQLGAICAVVLLYGKAFLQNRGLFKTVLIAFLPSMIIGLVLYRFIKDILIGNPTITLLALFWGGVVLILLELVFKEKEHHTGELERVNMKQAILIGIAQSISMFPGVSRAAATIIGGLFAGLKRKTAVEFSFLLAVPTMLAATILDLSEMSFALGTNEVMQLLLGFVLSFVIAVIAIKFLLSYITSHTFIPFGIYRIILAIFYWLALIR